MDTQDIITLALAGWGAILSTILALREFSIGRRSIQITLVYLPWSGGHKLSITNSGHRPITLTEIGFAERSVKSGPPMPIRANAAFYYGEGYDPPKLPLILTDGQTTEFLLSEYITECLSKNDNRFFIFVYDSEGRVYQKYGRAEHDTRYAFVAKK
jgi:hypothetical protein